MLAEFLRRKQRFSVAYLFAKTAAEIPLPESDVLFIFRDVYQYKALDELGISAYYLNKFREAADIFKRILDSKLLPPEQVARTEANLKFSLDKLGGAK